MSFGHKVHIWRTCMMRVLQVEKSRPLLFPYLLVFLELLLVVAKFVKVGELSFLKPHLPQKHVQCEGSHHETRIERESGSQGLHGGPGVTLSFNLAGAEYERERESMDGYATKGPNNEL